MSIEDQIKELKRLRESGGSWCIICGETFSTVRLARQHDLANHYDYALANHYDYALAQCYGDKELLKKWANLP